MKPNNLVHKTLFAINIIMLLAIAWKVSDLNEGYAQCRSAVALLIENTKGAE